MWVLTYTRFYTLSLHDPGGAREEADVVDGELDVEVGGALRLADVLLLEERERFRILLDGIGERVERLRSILGSRLRPGLEGRPGGSHGAVDV